MNKEHINIQTKEKLNKEIVYESANNTLLKNNVELFEEWNFEKNDMLGLDESQAELLMQMEIDEDIQSDDKVYLYRSVRLECGLTTLDEVVNHIERYKHLNQWNEPKDYSYEYAL